MASTIWLTLTIALAIGFGIVNGFNDAANAIATAVGTRVLSPRKAIIMAAFFNFLGTATGFKVAETIGKDILTPEVVSYQTALAALLSIVLWGALATQWGLPISLSHGLIAGVAGAGIASGGTGAIMWNVMLRILLAVILAPAFGFAAGFVMMVSLYWLFRRSVPIRVQSIFGNLQVISAGFVAYTHGLNDGQKVLAVIIMPLCSIAAGLSAGIMSRGGQ